MITHVEQVMGTVASITIDPGGCGDAEAAAALARACQTLHDADAMFSTFRPDSALMRNRRGDLGAEEMPAQLLEVLELSARAVRLTGGAFDPWAMPAGFDPTGLVKGWAAQQAAEELRNAGMAAAMVNAGGDIACFGPAPWRIGVRHPNDAQLLVCVAEVTTAIATSGGYERPGDILDTRSGRPPIADPGNSYRHESPTGRRLCHGADRVRRGWPGHPRANGLQRGHRDCRGMHAGYARIPHRRHSSPHLRHHGRLRRGMPPPRL